MTRFVVRTDLQRIVGWEDRLADLANAWRDRPYAYGRSDCGRFAQGAVAAITGVTLPEGIDWPTGWLGAAKFMISNGWDNIEAPMNELLPPVAAAASRIGDVVSYEAIGELHLAVRVGNTALTPGPVGLVCVERRRWLRAWKAGG